MKTNPWVAYSAAVFAVCALAAPHVSAQAMPAGLTGSLVANPAVVQVGASPKLTWSINYPSVV